MSNPPQRIQGSKTVADVERMANIAFEKLQPQIDSASGSGGVPQVEFVALQKQVTTLTTLSGADINNGGTGNPAPTPASQSTTVITDGTTITGDGDTNPISLIVPVSIVDGGTGTATPALVPGSNISITGAWPDQTIAFAFTFADSEVPTGTINGVNVTFTLAHTPQTGSLHVFSDGLRTTNFTLVGTTLTMGAAPTTSLICDYRF